VQQGAANVLRARGSGVRLGPRALAALYTGFMSAEELERADMLSGSASALCTAHSILRRVPFSLTSPFARKGDNA